MQTTTFETGATTYAVNDLILFTDNTQELAELRNKIYTDYINNRKYTLNIAFMELCNEARIAYKKSFRAYEDHKHIGTHFKAAQIKEYCTLYANDFENWKADHQ